MLFVRRSYVLASFLALVLLYLLFHSSEPAITNLPVEDLRYRIHWVKQPERYPVQKFATIPEPSEESLPRIQFQFPPEDPTTKQEREERRAAVRESLRHSWNGYKQRAWRKDEVSPISGAWRSSFSGWGATLVDTLDMLWIADMKDEFELAVEAVEQIDFTTTHDGMINVFETTIRYLGGLLAAHDLSEGKYPVLLKKAAELGDVLYSAFDTPNRMPMMRWAWMNSAQGAPIKAGTTTLLAEIGSLSLEFTRLSQLTGNPKYYDAVNRVIRKLQDAQSHTRIPGLWPVLVNAEALTFEYERFTLGGMADSMYEYIPKQHVMEGIAGADRYAKMYSSFMEPAMKYIFFKPMTENGLQVLLPGDARVTHTSAIVAEPKSQHLSCYAGGMVALGAQVFKRPDDLEVARQLVAGCIWAYTAMPAGVMPEVFHTAMCDVGSECTWDKDRWYAGVRKYPESNDEKAYRGLTLEQKALKMIKEKKLQPGFTDIGDARYILRPEAIESIFILYRITGEKQYQDIAWSLFQSIERITRARFGSAAVADVRDKKPVQMDVMESFWMAETLKYFYLIFEEPSVVSLDDYVLNTEAHPFKRPIPKAKQGETT